MFYPGMNFEKHPGMLDPDGTYHIPVGCFVIQTGGDVVLVDAGLGPDPIPFPAELAEASGIRQPPRFIAEGGRLPVELGRMGLTPDDISAVFLTHLHADHIGWIAPGGVAYFPNATVICSSVDWHQTPVDPAPGEMEGRAGLASVEQNGRLSLIDGQTFQIAPGVVAQHNPGHTPGHYIVQIRDRDSEAYLLGDAVHHPHQLQDPLISFRSETDPAPARVARQKLFTAFAGTDIALGMTHFPGLDFQRIGPDRQWSLAPAR
jgi:glyoxylase-like metal-dependent hydrolase (beta-lactamase superfamily II)